MPTGSRRDIPLVGHALPNGFEARTGKGWRDDFARLGERLSPMERKATSGSGALRETSAFNPIRYFPE